MRWALSWIVFGAGDFVSRLENALFGRWEWTSLYPVYNTLMRWSEVIQGDGPGPWKEPDDVQNAVRVARQATEPHE